MLLIRDVQIAAFEHALVQSFVERTVRWVEHSYPHQARAFGEGGARAAVTTATCARCSSEGASSSVSRGRRS